MAGIDGGAGNGRRKEAAGGHLGGREHAPDEVGAPGGAAAESVDGLPHGLERRGRVDLRPAAARPIRAVGGRSCAFGLGAHGERWDQFLGVALHWCARRVERNWLEAEEEERCGNTGKPRGFQERATRRERR